MKKAKAVKVKRYRAGQSVTVKVRYSQQEPIKAVHCKIVGIYKKFVVLHNGLFNFCAYKTDLASGAEIAVM